MALTAFYTDEDAAMMYKQGVADYLVKLIEKDALIAKTEKAISKN